MSGSLTAEKRVLLAAALVCSGLPADSRLQRAGYRWSGSKDKGGP
jgi:hypothetical protein